MNNKMIAETKRLILRRYIEEDLEDLFEYLSDPQVVKYEPYKIMNIGEVKETLNYRISSEEFIAVELKENGKMIGNIYLGKRDFESIEIGYVFNSKFWGQGYAKESCERLIEDAFNSGIHRIYAECDPNNESSWKLLENMSFQIEGHLKQNIYFWKDINDCPIWKDTLIYARLNDK